MLGRYGLLPRVKRIIVEAGPSLEIVRRVICHWRELCTSSVATDEDATALSQMLEAPILTTLRDNKKTGWDAQVCWALLRANYDPKTHPVIGVYDRQTRSTTFLPRTESDNAQQSLIEVAMAGVAFSRMDVYNPPVIHHWILLGCPLQMIAEDQILEKARPSRKLLRYHAIILSVIGDELTCTDTLLNYLESTTDVPEAGTASALMKRGNIGVKRKLLLLMKHHAVTMLEQESKTWSPESATDSKDLPAPHCSIGSELAKQLLPAPASQPCTPCAWVKRLFGGGSTAKPA